MLKRLLFSTLLWYSAFVISGDGVGAGVADGERDGFTATSPPPRAPLPSPPPSPPESFHRNASGIDHWDSRVSEFQ